MTQQAFGLHEAIRANGPRNDWTKNEIDTIYNSPLMKLAFAAVSSLNQLELMPSQDFQYTCHC